MARRGAGQVRGDEGRDERVWPAALRDQERVHGAGPAQRTGAGAAAGDRNRQGPPSAPEPWEAERWVQVRSEADSAVRRAAGTASGTSGPKPRRRGATRAATEQLDRELQRALGPRRAPRAVAEIDTAATAFRRGRYREAARLLGPLAQRAPQVAMVRELNGLTRYRLGQWRSAVRELEAFTTLTGTTEQHPVLADSYRALHRWGEVERLWDELREASPSAALVAEGRVVTAGALADRDRLTDAVELLQRGRWEVKRPREHHLRMAYALADLLERSGDVARAREIFAWIVAADADFGDVARRVRSLS